MRIHCLDLRFQSIPGIIAAYLIESDGEFALVETGPGSCHEALITGIRALGHEPDQIKHVFVTHIHLDHSGGAGWWAGQGAMVYCHPNAARHLIDPARLLESARLVYGDRMDSLWGETLPAPAAQVRALADGERVRVGAIEITAWDTPGHARHHHAYSIGDICFTGDVAGVRLQNSAYLSVAAAPPQFEPEAYIRSVDRLASMNFSRLYLTHFGEAANPADHLRRYRQRIGEVHQFVQARHREGVGEQQLREEYGEFEHAVAQAAPIPDSLWQVYELANPTSMCADGIRLYCEKAARA